MSKSMKAIVITEFGSPNVLRVRTVDRPEADPGSVVIRVRAFGLNRAEVHFRKGDWGDVAKVTGIECVGEVHDPGASRFARGQRVISLMGGMGRTIDGTYAEFVRVPETNVWPVNSGLSWTSLAAIPESYATAWTFLHHNLSVAQGQTLLIRGGTSALGQASVNLARQLGLRVLATTRTPERTEILAALGALPLIECADLSCQLRAREPAGIDCVLDIIGTATLRDSLKMVRYGGRVAMAGFLGGGLPLTLDPLRELPSGVQFSFFASAFTFGGPDLPLSSIPFADFIACAEAGAYPCVPAHVFDFEQIVEAHRLLESGEARGKIVVRAPN